MVKNSTKKSLQKKLGYNPHLIRLIDSFMIIPKYKVDNNKRISLAFNVFVEGELGNEYTLDFLKL